MMRTDVATWNACVLNALALFSVVLVICVQYAHMALESAFQKGIHDTELPELTKALIHWHIDTWHIDGTHANPRNPSSASSSSRSSTISLKLTTLPLHAWTSQTVSTTHPLQLISLYRLLSYVQSWAVQHVDTGSANVPCQYTLPCLYRKKENPS